MTLASLLAHSGAAFDGFVMFWLVMMLGINFSEGVRCLHCKDNILPGHAPADCPLVVVVAANVVAVAAAAGTAVSVSKLLPLKIMRLFPKTVLDAIKALHNKPSGSFDYDSKNISQVFDAAMHGHTSVEEASVWLQDRLMSASTNIEVTRISKTMDLLKTMGAERAVAIQDMKGAPQYLWALTHRCVSESDVVRLSDMTMDEAGSKGMHYHIKMVRPNSYHEFVRRLNFWIMFMHATGIDNCLVATPYVDDVVYVELQKGRDWKVVHELFLIYLSMVTDYEDYNLSNVYASGGQDSKLKEAEQNAKIYFRGRLGEPAPTKSGQAKAWNCAWNRDAKETCTSYNLKRDHPASSIGADGLCKYRHVCDKFIKDDQGNRTKCGDPNHVRGDCTRASEA